MFEWSTRFMARVAFAISEPSQIDGVPKGSSRNVLVRRTSGIVDHCMADIAIVANDFSCTAYMVAVMTTETTGSIEMPDVVRMRLPIGPHLGKEIGLKDTLDLSHGAVNKRLFLRVHIGIVCPVKILDTSGDRVNRFIRRIVRLT